MQWLLAQSSRFPPRHKLIGFRKSIEPDLIAAIMAIGSSDFRNFQNPQPEPDGAAMSVDTSDNVYLVRPCLESRTRTVARCYEVMPRDDTNLGDQEPTAANQFAICVYTPHREYVLRPLVPYSCEQCLNDAPRSPVLNMRQRTMIFATDLCPTPTAS